MTYPGMNYQGKPPGYWPPGYPGMTPPQGASPMSAGNNRQPIATILTPPISTALMNGASAFTQQMAQQQESILTVQLPVGPQYGAARLLLGEMICRGSYQTKQWVEQLQAQGINLGAQIQGDRLQLVFSCPTGKEAEMTQAAMTALCRPNWDAPTLEAIKTECLDELKQNQTMPEQKGFDRINALLYGTQHPYAMSTDGLIQDLQQQSVDRVSQMYRQVADYPERVVFSMVSALPSEQQQQLLNQGLQQFSWFPSPYRTTPPVQPVAPPQISRGMMPPHLIANPHAERAHLVSAWRAPLRSDPDAPVFALIMRMLGGMSGGFFRVMRSEGGMVYSTHQMSESHQHGNAYKVYAQVNFDKLPQAVQAMETVVRELIDQPIPESRLAMAKENYLLDLMSDSQAADKMAHRNALYLGDDCSPVHPQQLQEAIQRIRVEDIRRVAQKIFAPQQSGGLKVMTITAPHDVLQKTFPGQPIYNH